MMRLHWLAPALLYFASAPLRADCTSTIENGAFGSFSSFTIKGSGGEQQTSVNLTLSCDSILGLLSSDRVSMRVVSASATAANRPAMSNVDNPSETQTIPLRVCGTASCTNETETQIGKTFSWTGGALLSIGGKGYRAPVYFRTLAGNSLSAGRYRVTIVLDIGYSVCLIGLLGICVGTSGDNLVTTQLDMTVTSDCIAINAPDVNFGSAPLASGFAPVSQAITVSCTKGSVYSVGINNGANAGTGGVRKMKSGENTLSYDIYKGATGSRWGSIGAERWGSAASTGVSDDGTERRFAYTAKILTARGDTPPAGSYSDTLLVDITF